MKVYILRGMSGSGKSTFAGDVSKKVGMKNCAIVSSDDLLTDRNGRYVFSRDLLKTSHEHCQQFFREYVWNRVPFIVVDNTNTRYDEIQFYATFAKRNGYSVDIVQFVPEDRDRAAEIALRSTHDVPLENAFSSMTDLLPHLSVLST